jgi:AcrR family transcriptional regulator
MTSRGVGRPIDSSGDETRAAILVAARDLFASIGYAATSNRTVAAAAGVTNGTVYHYFKSKLDLFTATVNESYDRILVLLDSIVLPAPFAERITALGSLITDMHSTQAPLLRFLARVPLERARNPEIRDQVGLSAWTAYGLVRQFVSSGIDAGELAPDVDSEAMAATLTACLIGITLYSDLESEVTFGAMIGAFGRLLEGDHVVSRSSY